MEKALKSVVCTLETISSFSTITLVIYCGKKRFDGAKRNCFRQNHRFAKFYMYFVKRISINNFLIFEVVKKSFEGCYFSLYCFGLVALVEMRYIVFQHIRSYSLNGYGMELLRKLF